MKHITLCLCALLFVTACSDSLPTPPAPTTQAQLLQHQSCPTCKQDLRPVPIIIGLPSQSMADRKKKGEVLLGGCIGNPHDPETAYVCDKDRIWITPGMAHWQPLPKDFNYVQK